MKAVTIRRAALVLATLAVLFVLFFKSSGKISAKDLAIEDLLRGSSNVDAVREETRATLKRIEETNQKFIEEQRRRLADLEQERKLILHKLDELRRPPEDLTLRERLAFVFPYDQDSRFPAYIWQTWKYGLYDPEHVDKQLQDAEHSWSDKNPSFVHEIFNDDTGAAMVHHLYKTIPEVIETYESLPEPILKAQFIRYLVLLARGGVYADIDTVALQPIPNWIPENVGSSEIGLVVGIEADPNTPDWRKDYARRLQFGNWVIQCKPGHPVLREMVARVIERTNKRKEENRMELPPRGQTSSIPDNNRAHQIMEWTGDAVWTDVLLTYFNDYVQSGIVATISWRDFTKLDIPKLVSDVLVLPITSFSPGIGKMNAGEESHPLAFVKHYFRHTWNMPEE